MPALRPELATRQRTTTDPRKTTRTGAEDVTRFSRDKRLGDARAYRDVFTHARRSRDALFTVLFRRRPGPARLGLAISKKHCKLATGRNRIKRLVRESFRRNQALLSGMDVVVINTAAAARADNRRIASSLDTHWARISAAEDRLDG